MVAALPGNGDAHPIGALGPVLGHAPEHYAPIVTIAVLALGGMVATASSVVQAPTLDTERCSAWPALPVPFRVLMEPFSASPARHAALMRQPMPHAKLVPTTFDFRACATLATMAAV
jgi:hypothetical protein